MKNIYKVIATSLVLVLLVIACGKKESKVKDKFVVGISGAYIPWCYQEDGENKGFEVDVWNEIGKRTGYEVEFVVAKFQGLFGKLDLGEVDTIAHQISRTDERIKKYDFTTTYAFSPLVFTIREDETIDKLEDLKGKTIGVSTGGNSETVLRALNEEFDLNFNIITYDSTGSNIENEIVLERIDARFLGSIASAANIKKGNLPLKLFDPKYNVEENQYPFQKNDEAKAKLEKVNKALKEIKEEGLLKELSEKWFGIDVTDEGA